MSHLESIVPLLFKQALGQWASGVTVVTTLRKSLPHGMTASSFSSLSLDPPLVLVSVDQRARLHQLLPETGRYGVSILAKGQDLLSNHFAGRPNDSLQTHGYRPKACLFLTERWRIWHAMCLARFQVAITLFILDASLMPKSGRIANR